MHPQIVQDAPGTCPMCGMALVDASHPPAKSDDVGLGPLTWRNYLPLILVILGITTFATVMTTVGTMSSPRTFVHWFMAAFFLVFATFKLIDLKGFAAGYASYDLLAQRVLAYGYAYPFIELGFGLAMAFGVRSPMLLWTEFAVMSFSGLGVLIKVLKKERFRCVCLGTFLKVPLTTVTLVEDFGMAALALYLLYV
jgi:hypothetical protein